VPLLRRRQLVASTVDFSAAAPLEAALVEAERPRERRFFPPGSTRSTE